MGDSTGIKKREVAKLYPDKPEDYKDSEALSFRFEIRHRGEVIGGATKLLHEQFLTMPNNVFNLSHIMSSFLERELRSILKKVAQDGRGEKD